MFLFSLLTVTTAKSISHEQLQNSSSTIFTAGPGKGEGDLTRTVILPNAAVAALPEGMKSFKFSLKTTLGDLFY